MAVRGGAAAAVLVALAACGPGVIRPTPEPVAPQIDAGAALETVPATDIGRSLVFHFNWPDGLVGRCRSRRRAAGAGRQEPVHEVTFRVRVERTADEVRVVTDDLASEGNRVLGEEALGPLVETVEPDGRYRAAEGVADALAGMPSLAAQPPAERARAVQDVEARLAETWKLLVGAWAGRELPLGATYAATAPETMPGGSSARVRIAIQADGRVPCWRGDREARCVRVQIRSQPEQRATDALVPTLLAVLAPGRGIAPHDVVPDVATVMTSAVVITEPDTLVPHRFVLRRRFVLTGSTPTDPKLALERAEEITRVCAWGR
jgi:hypothetical protein